MQEHQQEPNHQNQFPVSDYSPILNPQADAVTVDTQIDAYLDAICAGLPPETPANAVLEMRQEMQGHLQAAVIAMQELGYSPEQAVEHALAQFGKPQVVARQWQEEWETTLVETKAVSFWPSLKLAWKMWTVSEVLALFASAILMMMTFMEHEAPLRLPLMMTIFYAPPLVSGTLIGLRARRHPVLATLSGYALTLPLLIIGFAAINAAQSSYVSWLTGKTYAQYSYSYIGAGFHVALSFAPLWIILSVFSSGVVTLGRRFKTRRRQIAR